MCNAWSKDGNVTTYSPETPGSGLTCYSGDKEHYEVFTRTVVCKEFVRGVREAHAIFYIFLRFIESSLQPKSSGVYYRQQEGCFFSFRKGGYTTIDACPSP